MSMIGDMVRDSEAQFLCQKIAEKIKKYPEAEKALKEIGIERLDELPNVPQWAQHYYELFRN